MKGKMIENPFKYDDEEEFEQINSATEIRIDPINPALGFYYLWNEVEGKTHTHIDGSTRFQSFEKARFARSCSTMWPFLKIFRHWNFTEAKKQAENEKQQYFKIFPNEPFRDI